ncbi:hypothetical protein TCAL_06471 [Tigriopus californicus]|uniref:Dual specificity protein phosphatase n=1 Tax=Tigriopus californicus TaxID=6832 RepID=A0A553PLK5_TIGCA|nr:dual specificity protein phosphatase 3-like [Tigriopus californicus]TRY78567.1 hypothetical protein TCAL_06471 [Tigriopus californicus]|eukprot:TCALIF_06471-PA protein Name:"Similar to DUSP3 Dual specificity protein phosphatase 3 (Pongo abelii)" AED:0.01 eAED:0.01 QI:0/-1/0/1/-1/1/1/0/201
MTLNLSDYHLANSSTASYLSRSFNIEPPKERMMPGVPRYQTQSDRFKTALDCDEVYPGIVIGSGETMRNVKYLQKLGVTHVLNMAENDVNVSSQRYSKAGICYKGYRIKDLPQEDISATFDECVRFMDRALCSRMGLVYVGCLLGYSRSATVVAAYLMLKQNMSASEALGLMRRSREVHPNMGFLHQLGNLDNSLRRSRHR